MLWVLIFISALAFSITYNTQQRVISLQSNLKLDKLKAAEKMGSALLLPSASKIVEFNSSAIYGIKTYTVIESLVSKISINNVKIDLLQEILINILNLSTEGASTILDYVQHKRQADEYITSMRQIQYLPNIQAEDFFRMLPYFAVTGANTPHLDILNRAAADIESIFTANDDGYRQFAHLIAHPKILKMMAQYGTSNKPPSLSSYRITSYTQHPELGFIFGVQDIFHASRVDWIYDRILP